MLQQWLCKAIAIQQWHRERKTQALVLFECLPVNTIEAGEVTVVASVLTGSHRFVTAVIAFVKVVTGSLNGFDVLFYAVVTVVDAVLAVHRTWRVVMGLIAAAGRNVLKIDGVIASMVESDATVKSVRGKRGRNLSFLATTSKVMLLLW
jgi:hypothetical protein